MAFINFIKPKDQLEEGGRTAAPVQEDAGEPEKTCPNCRKAIPLSRLWANHLVCPCGCHFTRSMPVSISVTQCSTWSRTFISINQKLPSLSRRNSRVPAPT